VIYKDDFAVRKPKLAQVRTEGFDPFSQKCSQTYTSVQIISAYTSLKGNGRVAG
jgi:hypothetical protein